MKRTLVILFILSLTASPLARAQDTVWEMAKSEKYGTKAGGMLGRGLLNAATCFVDLIVHTVEETQAGPPLVGTLTGLGSGIGCTALRAGSGTLDVATFWVPGFNGFPVARSYSNCMLQDEAFSSGSGQTSRAGASATQKAAAKKHDPYQYVKK